MRTTYAKCILLLLLPLLNFNATCQVFTENELSGKWKVVNVFISKIPKGKETETEKQKAAFLKSTFRFDPGKYFTFTIDNETDDLELDKMEIRAAHWQLESSSGLVTIAEWKEKDSDKYDLMEIKIKRDGDKIFFLISDTYFKLEVQKL